MVGIDFVFVCLFEFIITIAKKLKVHDFVFVCNVILLCLDRLAQVY